MKNIIAPMLLVLTIGILGFVNFIYPLFSIFSQGDSLDFNSYRYFFIIACYICVTFIVWTERENLASWNLDRLSLLVLVLFAVVRVNLQIPYEQNYKNLIIFLGLSLLAVCAVNWKKIPQTSMRWALIGLLSCVFVIPLAFIESQLLEKYATSSILYQTKFLSYAAQNLLYTASFVAPYEEIIIRGVFWGQLRRWNISDNRIVWIQGFLFWLLHPWQILTPVTFFLTLPALILILSSLVKYSKQLFPSLISHTLINFLSPILISFIF
ncbi:MAG: CPBP family intramembrane metalloprotease [Anaerolineales bacterium]|nr:CPBP family intramembrane metalloprotease [Anaerolineales bacterium]